MLTLDHFSFGPMKIFTFVSVQLEKVMAPPSIDLFQASFHCLDGLCYTRNIIHKHTRCGSLKQQIENHHLKVKDHVSSASEVYLIKCPTSLNVSSFDLDFLVD